MSDNKFKVDFLFVLAMLLTLALGLFSQINIFAFGVDKNGNLVDTAEISQTPWLQLIADAKKTKN